jgi:hypothetical protein
MKRQTERIRKETPIDEILIPFSRPGFSIEKVRKGLQYYGIKTAEQLTTYNQFAFRWGGNTEQRGSDHGPYGEFSKAGYDYLERCLRAADLSFANQPSGNPTPFQVIGRKNMKEYLLLALPPLKTRQNSQERYHGIKPTGERFYGAEEISREARNSTILGNYNTEEIWKVFRVGNTKPLLEELAQEGKINRVETNSGICYKVKAE